MTFKKLVLIVLTAFTSHLLFSQTNMELQSHITYNERLSDVWGYTDSLGNEYALVCLRAGIAIEDITDPKNPQRVSRIDSPRSTWRDAKTYGHYAYFVNENSGGVQVVNLKNLPAAPDSTDTYFWTPTLPNLGTLGSCHNLYIDTATGYGFLAGCNINNGGILILDLFTTPGQPIFVAAAAPIYSHDVYTRGDFIYSSDIYNGSFSIQNMADKQNIFTVAAQNTPSSFTHNTWLSDDGNTLFTTEETGNAILGAYDISDMNNIQLLDAFKPLASINEGLIPHNVHVKNDFLITSYYTEGIIITDATRPDNLIEVGNYDTFKGPNGSFDGVWGAFPFFDSNIVLASDINTGLYILKPNYERACYLEGKVTDSLTAMPLNNVDIKIQSNDLNQERSDISGIYKTGQLSAGTFSVTYSKEGYIPKTIAVDLMKGIVSTLDIALLKKDDTTIEEISIQSNTFSGCAPLSIQLSPSPVEENANYRWTLEGNVSLNSTQTSPNFEIGNPGTYLLKLEKLSNDTFMPVDEKEVIVLGAPNIDFDINIENKNIYIINNTPNATSYVWKFGDGNKSEDVSPTYTYQTDGNYTIELTAFNECTGITSAQNISIMTTSTADFENLEKLTASPNPFSTELNIEYKFNTLDKATYLFATDVLGKNVLRLPIQQKEGKFSIGNDWNAGIYFIQFGNGTQLSVPIKIIKHK